jgi:VanZ family protein
MSLLRYWKSIVLGLLILIICLLPSSEISKIDFLKFKYEDLLIHLFIFIAFSFFLAYDMYKMRLLNNKKTAQLILALSISILFGLTTELLQHVIIVINRTANLYDFIFDSLGSVVGIVAIRFIKQ